ncbi:bifunctional diaminohydroxyphosphoribosylaminopyrimidine deaminase/5-amino-6-(5-phosphoribosylamino)uracil reductase RibD [Heliorestis acidaminivorans]|uniref:Riboflavin biosynthesis protein RibD n=1 Tax=Heliorestis acidaminivorans TaxID=553427 RepID=A0A6I0EUL9_9FIRM|nr:bifunctional diaminohydroxyphosphoribosylaminopyrimidine deaminase/5-amino-6-(5-phosphoribosylamino)uracil reductase RibD [Heliorestis acidaminivorans]KAB2954465.1 bifunctional diaminohydroxyphosphoribosylaminopyrimidine deaminase/5-amino-6-(5-phosphoribosylamino)uracil reductase RibD [Heliorestis acidaminivorans]
MKDADVLFMQRAIELALRGKGKTSPNPLVGAVIVKDGQIVGEGYHQKAGTAHAEIHALAQANEEARGSTLYVTLEPCSHYGRTPPCTEAILKAGVKKVVMAMLDPNPQVAGKGMEKLRHEGVEVQVGLLSQETAEINQPFLTWITAQRPHVLAKWAMTVDGKIATLSGDSRWISCPTSRQLVHQWRQDKDAILVGIGTVLADDPQLTTRLADFDPTFDQSEQRHPLRVILDSKGRTPLTAKVLKAEGKTLIAVTEQAPLEKVKALEAIGATVWLCPQNEKGRIDLPSLMARLGQAGITSLLVEGGSSVHGAFLEDKLVDQIAVFIAPKLVGGATAPSPVGGGGVELMSQAWLVKRWRGQPSGEDYLLEGTLREVIPCLQGLWKN